MMRLVMILVLRPMLRRLVLGRCSPMLALMLMRSVACHTAAPKARCMRRLLMLARGLHSSNMCSRAPSAHGRQGGRRRGDGIA